MSDNLDILRELEITQRKGWRWRLGGFVGSVQDKAIEKGWLVKKDKGRYLVSGLTADYAKAIVEEQIHYWDDMGVTPTEAWMALTQASRPPYMPREWPEVRAIMRRWLNGS